MKIIEQETQWIKKQKLFVQEFEIRNPNLKSKIPFKEKGYVFELIGVKHEWNNVIKNSPLNTNVKYQHKLCSCIRLKRRQEFFAGPQQRYGKVIHGDAD